MDSDGSVRPRVTWIEVAIVTVVLAVLAALAVPQFSEAGMDPRSRELRLAVQTVQGQIEMYRLQHDNQYPSCERFVEQMTQPTDIRGQVIADAADLQFGPYLRCIPPNPYSGTNDITGQQGGSKAWYYNEKTGEFRPNRTDTR